ncbi:MAG: S1C family serine protease [Gammaproteobacteria bacterium]
MSLPPDRSISPELNPRPEQVDYDLDRALNAVVTVRTRVPDDAFTAGVLGTERAGHGVAIGRPGLVLTIGYLVAEAEQTWLLDHAGRPVAGDVLAYDYETGFGLVQALGRFAAPPLELGQVRDLGVGSTVVMAGHGGRRQALRAGVSAVSEFAGYWEYVIDQALFTTPPHPNWGGAAVFDAQGRVCAIGSLYLDQTGLGGTRDAGNMSVPVDLLVPVMDELLTYGRTLKPPRPWLGMFVTEVDDALVVAGVYDHAPAARVLRTGDVILALGGTTVASLAPFFRRMWACGEAGVEIPLTIERDGRMLDVQVRSMDRRDFWKRPALH